MPQIREDQRRCLSQARRQDYVDRAALRLRECFAISPRQTEAELRARIELGIDRAASYAITGERGVFRYLCLMMIYGDEFDRDERLAWARKVLDDEERHAVLSKAHWLFEVGRRAYPAFVALTSTPGAPTDGR